MRENSKYSFADSYAEGKAKRAAASRESLGDFPRPARDLVAIIAKTNLHRIPSLIPLRYERMGASPFAFLRGGAAIMAEDLAGAVRPNILVQGCGDCHLMNFGAFSSPEGNVLFDINDFDETLPGVDFTVDVKRLAASFAVAAQDAGESQSAMRRAAKAAASAYSTHMRKLARLSPMDAWQTRVRLQNAADQIFDGPIAEKLTKLVTDSRDRRKRDDAHPREVLDEITGLWRIIDRPPDIFHTENVLGDDAAVDLPKVFETCRATLLPEVASLLGRYRLDDFAFKVVGVGSVGVYCAIALFVAADGAPIYLQIKEAQTSVQEPLCEKPWSGQQGARVVSGQRIMQAASDIFLGWSADQATGRQFYIRHLKNHRLSSVSDLLQTEALHGYAVLCGVTLARAHARSGASGLIAGYIGKSEAFADAIASFAMLYAKQNQHDYEVFLGEVPRSLTSRRDASSESRAAT